MSLVPQDEQNTARELRPEDYKKDGTLTNVGAEVALVVGSAESAEHFISSRQYSLLWRDADLLFQSPRPMSVYENTYILEPKRLTWAC